MIFQPDAVCPNVLDGAAPADPGMREILDSAAGMFDAVLDEFVPGLATTGRHQEMIIAIRPQRLPQDLVVDDQCMDITGEENIASASRIILGIG